MSSPDGASRLVDRAWYRVLRAVFVALGVAFLAFAVRRAWNDVAPRISHLSPATIAVSIVLALAAVLLVAQSWAVLVGDGLPRRYLRRSYLTALIGKYIPGGMFQALAQIATSHESGVPVARAATGLAVSLVVTIAAGSAAALPMVFAPSTPTLARWGAIAAVTSIALLWRRVLIGAQNMIERLTGRQVTTRLIPEQSSLLVAWLLTAVGFVAAGWAFAVVADPFLSAPLWYAIGAFAFAWLVGFLVIPVPAGVGIREAALALALSPHASVGVVVAASLVHRLVTLIAEAAAFAAARFPAGRPSGDATSPGDRQRPG